MKKVKDLKSKKAITLISLVVTIIIIVILAAVAINIAIGNNGLKNKAKFAKNSYINAVDKEKEDVDFYADLIDKYIGNSREVGSMTTAELKEFVEAIIESKNESSSGDTVPEGTIIAYYSGSAPTGYLACDGTEYDISQYPKLAELINNTTGSYGTSTTGKFKVPDLRGEFLRGTGTNSHANQGSGATVGTHQDATEELNIRKDINNKLFIESGGNISMITQNVDSDYKIGTSTLSAGMSYTTGSTTWKQTSSYKNNIYTSRPTNTSVLYCIKCD